MSRRTPGLLFALLLVTSACGPAVARTPANMRDVAWVHLAPEGFDFEVEVPTEPNARSSRDRLDGFDEPIVTTEWQIQADDRSAVFSVSHVRYPSGFLSHPDVARRVLDWAPRYAAESIQGGRITRRSNVRAPGGVRGVAFAVRAPDRSTLEGRFLIRGDEGLLGITGITASSRWENAGDRMLRSLRFR